MSDHEFEFQEIYETFQPKIYRYLARLVGEYETEDLIQEVFIKVNRSLPRFKGESQLSTWIYRIATNAALDRLRSASFRRNVQTQVPGSAIAATTPDIEDKNVWSDEKTPLVDQQLIRKEMNDCIKDFIEKLPENYKTVLVLCELEELKNKETANILGISIETVKIRLHRARKKLKKELETHCSFYRDERNELACDLKGAFERFRQVY
jgi:RNA polymerase sigma-70 factor (ECF subfamily)